jgi:3-phenylpropionate/trans-cinnamate dioxygenase ferredoxin subunit
MTFHPLEKLDKLHNGYRKAFQVMGKQLLLLVIDNNYHLIENRCPHQNAPLTAAWADENRIICSLHQWEFDLYTGVCKQTKRACDSIKIYEAIFDDNIIGVML